MRYRRNRDSLDDPAVAERAEQWLAKLRKEDEAEQQRRVEEVGSESLENLNNNYVSCLTSYSIHVLSGVVQ